MAPGRGDMLFLDGRDIAALVPMRDCIEGIERAFAALDQGSLPTRPGVLGAHVPGGGFHVKTAALGGDPGYFAAKVNANFPGNREKNGLPTIQGVVALFDAGNGRPLALMDSIEVTLLRTAAASAVAARHLARSDASTITLCGCGSQARSHLRALRAVRPLTRAMLFDTRRAAAEALAEEMRAEPGIECDVVDDLTAAVRRSDICITCTPSRRPLLDASCLHPGLFIAAVGADSEDKQELDPGLLASACVVTDITDQAARIGELHHAIDAGVMTVADVHAELGQLASGARPGRTADDEVFVFDSTGTALQDVALVALAYGRAGPAGRGIRLQATGRGDRP